MYIHTQQELAAAIRGRRHALNLTQERAAEIAGVSRSWFARFETGKGTADVDRLLSVLEALGFMVDLKLVDEIPTRDHDAVAHSDLDQLLEEYDRGHL